ncbi:MAG: hypothetical protein NC421_08185 [Lachnospiraceae bacterium]|nr:hypothetical protein [Lachnospiraceae bacterium]
MTHLPDIISADSIDYANAPEVISYQQWLASIYQSEGGFSYPRPTSPLLRILENEALRWLQSVEESIDGYQLADIAAIIPAYDFTYRICHHRPPLRFLKETRLKTINRWLKGDKSITVTTVALMIADQIDIDINSIDRRFALFYFDQLSKWTRELQIHRRFSGIPLSEACNRLCRMLKENLSANLGSRQDEMKRQWVNDYIVDDVSALDPATLDAYTSLMLTATTYGYLTESLSKPA